MLGVPSGPSRHSTVPRVLCPSPGLGIARREQGPRSSPAGASPLLPFFISPQWQVTKNGLEQLRGVRVPPAEPQQVILP